MYLPRFSSLTRAHSFLFITFSLENSLSTFTLETGKLSAAVANVGQSIKCGRPKDNRYNVFQHSVLEIFTKLWLQGLNCISATNKFEDTLVHREDTRHFRLQVRVNDMQIKPERCQCGGVPNAT